MYHVESPFQRIAECVGAPVFVVGRGDDVEALPGPHFQSQFRYRHHFFGEDGNQVVLDNGRYPGQFFDPDDFSSSHGSEHSPWNQGILRWSVGDQAGVIPTEQQIFFRSSAAPLDQVRGVPADGSREMITNPAFGRARYAGEQKGAVGDQGSDGGLDQRLPTDVFGFDGLSGHFTTED